MRPRRRCPTRRARWRSSYARRTVDDAPSPALRRAPRTGDRRAVGEAASVRDRRRPSLHRRLPRLVGIVMAKSAEGDAVARFFVARDGVEVIEQPAFWEIRASDRLVDSLRRGVRGAGLRDRRLLDPARDVDALRPHGRDRRCADAVLGSDRGDGVPAVMKRRAGTVAGPPRPRPRGARAHPGSAPAGDRAALRRRRRGTTSTPPWSWPSATTRARPATRWPSPARSCAVRAGAPAEASARARDRRRRSHPARRRRGDVAATALQRPLPAHRRPLPALRFASLFRLPVVLEPVGHDSWEALVDALGEEPVGLVAGEHDAARERQARLDDHAVGAPAVLAGDAGAVDRARPGS